MRNLRIIAPKTFFSADTNPSHPIPANHPPYHKYRSVFCPSSGVVILFLSCVRLLLRLVGLPVPVILLLRLVGPPSRPVAILLGLLGGLASATAAALFLFLRFSDSKLEHIVSNV